jgi:hypothetical protein
LATPAIEEVQSGVAAPDLIPTPVAADAGCVSAWTRTMPWALAAILAIALAAALILIPSRTRQLSGPVMHLTLAAQAHHEEADRRGSAVAISQDGTRVAYVAAQGSPDTGKSGDLALISHRLAEEE